MDADARCGFDDAGADLQQLDAERVEFGLGEFMGGRDRVAQRQHQPIGTGGKDKAHLICDCALAGGATGLPLDTA